MTTLHLHSQPQQLKNRAKNILIRHHGGKEVRNDCFDDQNYQHPENCYLTKYFPKYYQNLTLMLKPQSSLLSKVKRIKKLTRFAGKFYGWTPPVNWFKILGQIRKEIEELPIIDLSLQTKRAFWAKTTLRAVKFFFQITKLQLPTYQCREFTSQDFLVVWKAFSKHAKNMRRLEILEVFSNERIPFSFDHQVLDQKLNGMSRLLGKLKALKSSFSSDVPQTAFLQTKNIFSNLTNLNYFSDSAVVSPYCQTIPQLCKNLKSFTVQFRDSQEDPNFNLSQFRSFFTLVQELPKLQSISTRWSGSWPSDFWSYFTPLSSLKRLAFQFRANDMQNVEFQAPIHDQYKMFVKHWKEIKDLDALELDINCQNCGDEMLFTKYFITAVLTKVSKLASFQCKIDLRYEGIWRFEPFFREEVPHLCEHLKKFKVEFVVFGGSVRFDFGFLKDFKNLEEIDYQGTLCDWANVGDAVRLLERNYKRGEFSKLKLGGLRINSKEELENILKMISQAKKGHTNLKIVLGLKLEIQAGDDEIMYLDQFCKIIETEMVKGLIISLDMRYQVYSDCDGDGVKRVLDKHPGLRNTEIQIYYKEDVMHYIKRDGEKEQLLFYV